MQLCLEPAEQGIEIAVVAHVFDPFAGMGHSGAVPPEQPRDLRLRSAQCDMRKVHRYLARQRDLRRAPGAMEEEVDRRPPIMGNKGNERCDRVVARRECQAMDGCGGRRRNRFAPPAFPALAELIDSHTSPLPQYRTIFLYQNKGGTRISSE